MFFEIDEFFALALCYSPYGDARPIAHDFGNFVLAYGQIGVFTFLFPLDFGFFFLLDIIVAKCLVFSAKFVVFSAFCLAQIEFGLLDFVFQIANFAGSGKGKIFFLDAASSIRSIALSGRNLSATYLSDKIAAEDIASSVIVTP